MSYNDRESGLYYLQSRYYDPEVGRFLNADVEFDTDTGLQGYNILIYCGNSPVNRIDVSGRASYDCVRDDDALDGEYVKNDGGGGHYFDAQQAILDGKYVGSSSGNSITIFRYYATKESNLAPRPGKDYDGLSFSTSPPRKSGVYVATTIDEVNSTGYLYATIDNSKHVTIRPIGGTVLEWMEQGMNSIWSQILSRLVVELRKW